MNDGEAALVLLAQPYPRSMRRVCVLVAAALVATVSLTVDPTHGLEGPAPTNPVRDRSYPDPFVLAIDDDADGQPDTYYAYATDGDLGEVQLIKSTTLTTWDN